MEESCSPVHPNTARGRYAKSEYDSCPQANEQKDFPALKVAKHVLGIAESHASIKIIKPMKSDDYIALLARKLVQWYLDAPAREGRAPPAGKIAAMAKRLRTGRGRAVQMRLVASLCCVWINKPLQPYFKPEQDSHT